MEGAHVAAKKPDWSIPLSMLAGLVFGQLVDPSLLRRAILPLTFLMVYPMMVAVNIQEVFKPGGGKLQGVTLAINFVLIPLLGYSLGLVFFGTTVDASGGYCYFAAAHFRHDHFLDRVCQGQCPRSHPHDGFRSHPGVAAGAAVPESPDAGTVMDIPLADVFIADSGDCFLAVGVGICHITFGW